MQKLAGETGQVGELPFLVLLLCVCGVSTCVSGARVLDFRCAFSLDVS